jgi:fructoselysine-6-phosphate deglycase
MDMSSFDKKAYLEKSAKVVEALPKIEALADKIVAKGFKNIVFFGVGGTYYEWYPVAEYLKKLSTLPVYLENAGEMVLKTDLSYLNKDSLVVTSSASGDTKEILEAVKFCKSKGIDVYGFTENAKAPLAELLTDCELFPAGGLDNEYSVEFLFMLRIYNKLGYFDKYDKFATQIAKLPENLARFREQFEPRAQKIAQKYYNAPLTMLVGSGALWGETYLFSMCILEEMQWVRTRPVTSADFFHGALELVDETLPVFLFKGEDEYRPLDERVERFCKKYAPKFEVFDTKDFVLEGIDDEFRPILTPMIITSLITDRLSKNYQRHTGHDLNFRRYYRQFAY